MRQSLEQILEDSRSPDVRLRKRAALESMYDDPDLRLRRSVRKRLAGYAGPAGSTITEDGGGALARPSRRG